MNKIMEERRGALFFIFLHTNEKRPTTKDQTTQKSGLTHDLMISFFILTFAHSPETQSRGGRRQRRRRRRRRRERNNSALYSFIVLSHLLKQISSSLGSVLRLRESADLFFFCCTKGHVQLCAFFDTKFNDNKNNNHYNHNGDEEEDEEESEA